MIIVFSWFLWLMLWLLVMLLLVVIFIWLGIAGQLLQSGLLPQLLGWLVAQFPPRGLFLVEGEPVLGFFHWRQEHW